MKGVVKPIKKLGPSIHFPLSYFPLPCHCMGCRSVIPEAQKAQHIVPIPRCPVEQYELGAHVVSAQGEAFSRRRYASLALRNCSDWGNSIQSL